MHLAQDYLFSIFFHRYEHHLEDIGFHLGMLLFYLHHLLIPFDILVFQFPFNVILKNFFEYIFLFYLSLCLNLLFLFHIYV